MLETARKVLHAIGPMHRALSRYRGQRIHAASTRVPGAARLGTYYGGWTIIPRLLGRQSLVYSVGVGSDISFDRALIERFGCQVHAFDPTPVARAWIAEQAVPPQFHFHPIGLAASDGDVEFALPPRADYDSYSLPQAGVSQPLVSCPVRRLERLMTDLGHTQLDVLKMDIEGFEFGVVADILAGPIRPRQWLIEFHHKMMYFTADQTRAAVSAIEAAGYRLFCVSNVGHEYSFVRGDALS
jgi:FkbM family methyltransferase